MKKISPDILLWLLLAIVWSCSFSMIKVALGTVGPMSLAAGRIVIAALLLFVFLKIRGHSLPRKLSTWLSFTVLGCFGSVLPFFLIGWGELYVDSGLAAVLMGIAPVTTVLLAHLVLEDEPLTSSKLFGIVFGMAGLFILVGLSAISSIGEHVGGQVAVLCGAVCYALASLYTKKYMRLPATVLASGSLIMGALIITPIALIIEQPFTNFTPSLNAVMAIIFLGVFSTGLATLCYFYLIERLGASFMQQINFIIPVLGTIIGVVFLGEALKPTLFIALAIVLVAIYLVNRKPKAKRLKITD